MWTDDVIHNLDQRDAQKYCRTKGFKLPTSRDFEIAESHGFREAFKDMAPKEDSAPAFWSSTIFLRAWWYAWAFELNSGFMGTYDRNTNDDIAAR